LTSYGFLQTLPLARSALAIRIIFPSVRVIQVSFNLTGLPASLGKQKNRPSWPVKQRESQKRELLKVSRHILIESGNRIKVPALFYFFQDVCSSRRNTSSVAVDSSSAK
ncbi:hypothetical protein, partial [Oceanimonas sp. CAM02]|uniref:hypothetical protein n=1 Tax=Oceanimonas sp. CAM02 TaxID=3080336 RepID=UPI002936C7CC